MVSQHIAKPPSPKTLPAAISIRNPETVAPEDGPLVQAPEVSIHDKAICQSSTRREVDQLKPLVRHTQDGVVVDPTQHVTPQKKATGLGFANQRVSTRPPPFHILTSTRPLPRSRTPTHTHLHAPTRAHHHTHARTHARWSKRRASTRHTWTSSYQRLRYASSAK